MVDKKKRLIPYKYLVKYGSRAGDEFIKDSNVAAGNVLCDRCSGTGNDFYFAYHMCNVCDGTGEKP